MGMYRIREKLLAAFGSNLAFEQLMDMARFLKVPQLFIEKYLQTKILQEEETKLNEEKPEADSLTLYDNIQAPVLGKTLKIKLIITDIKTNPTMRQLLSPVLAHIPGVSQQFGMFHTAVVIGPWYAK